MNGRNKSIRLKQSFTVCRGKKERIVESAHRAASFRHNMGSRRKSIWNDENMLNTIFETNLNAKHCGFDAFRTKPEKDDLEATQTTKGRPKHKLNLPKQTQRDKIIFQ
jgi:hypothetical protein